MTEKEKMWAGLLFDPAKLDNNAEDIRKCLDLCYRYNYCPPGNTEEKQQILKQIIGSMGKNCVVTSPFWCDHGYNISMGDSFYSNHNLVITDGVSVTFGNHVLIAPNCCFTTAEHAMDPEQRKMGIEIARPIKIGNNVWFGAGVTVLAGSVIGDNTVIGAGSVVKGNIPSGVVAAGVPCRVIRKISYKDKIKD